MSRWLVVALALAGCATASKQEADPAPAGSEHAHAEHAPAEHGQGEHAHGGHGAGDGATVHHRFDDVDKWTAAFDNPERDAWQKPDAVIQQMAIAEGMVVADIGAGTGYFNPHLAKAVGETGRVIASDIEPNLVAHMTERAQKEGTPQVEARLGEPSDPKLAPGEVDRVLLVDTYHHIDARKDYFTRLKTALKPGGMLIVVDFKSGELPVGPPEDHRIPKNKVLKELADAGWTVKSDADVLPYQFVVALTPTP